VARSKTFETNGELDVARTNDVLDLEIRELGIEAKLLNDAGVFPRGELGVVLGLGTRNHHLARCEDQGSGLGLTDTHNHRSETLFESALYNNWNCGESQVPLGYIPHCEHAEQSSSSQDDSPG
jgi:hypothetical protein